MPDTDPPATLPTGSTTDVPFVQAAHYTATAHGRAIGLIVIHTMEAPEKPGTAMAVAKWFAGSKAPQASAHYCIDAEQVVQCVHDGDVAWHAPGANKNGIGLEHAGYAAQNDAQWQDAYSTAMLMRSAMLTATLCAAYDIPVEYVDSAGLLLGRRGITTHAQVSKAWKRSNHTDPGSHFPMDQYISLVQANLNASSDDSSESSA